MANPSGWSKIEDCARKSAIAEYSYRTINKQQTSMKKVFLFSMMSLMALAFCALVGFTKDEYVDLGLPSGTKWKTMNEVKGAGAKYNLFTYTEAMERFGNSLPTKEQYEELIAECKWSWTGSGCVVTGPNGNSITLPADGFLECEGYVSSVGNNGVYWSSTSDDSGFAYFSTFDSSSKEIYSNNPCFGHSVRLVKK